MTMQPPPNIMQCYGLHDATLHTETPIAHIWKVTHGGRPAALKIYKNRDPRNEAAGFAVLRACDGQGAVKIHHYADGVALMDWLDGPSLGDIARRGDIMTADSHLIDTARTLHQAPVPAVTLRPVAADIADLLASPIAPDCAPALAADFRACKGISAQLLATHGTLRPLHGDLHHDNVAMGCNGWVAFDAKGVLGEPAYELANAFRNPPGCDAAMRDPARAHALASQWAKACDVPTNRVLSWAAVHAALSIHWSRNGTLGTEEGADLIALFLASLSF